MVSALDYKCKDHRLKKTLGGLMVHSVFHPTKVDQISTKESWDLLVKTNLSPRSSYAALGKVNPIHEKWL